MRGRATGSGPRSTGRGFTERQLHASEERTLLNRGYGITNVVPRVTATAAELSPTEYVAGGEALRAKVAEYWPRILAVLGVGAYRTAFDRPKAGLGLQPELLGATRVWVLPNPSGLNAHYQLDALAELFREVRLAADAP